MTHRQFEAWKAWLEEDWNRPDRGDFYQMGTSAEVRRIAVGLGIVSGSRVSLDDLRLTFQPRERQETALTPDELKQRQEWSRMAWCAALGVTPPDGR